MKKTAFLAMILAVGVAVSGCDAFRDSPEQKAFKAFVAKCKADPTTAACKEWEETKNAPGGN